MFKRDFCFLIRSKENLQDTKNRLLSLSAKKSSRTKLKKIELRSGRLNQLLSNQRIIVQQRTQNHRKPERERERVRKERKGTENSRISVK